MTRSRRPRISPLRGLCLLWILSGCAGEGRNASVDQAHQMILDRRLTEAAAILERYPNDRLALRLLGRLRLNQNRPKEADEILARAVELVPKDDPIDMIAIQEMAWARVRMDDYNRAYAAYQLIGQIYEAARAEKLAQSVPYVIDWRGRSGAAVGLSSRTPLPAIPVRINDRRTGNFIIDTTAPDIVLDLDFAKNVGPQILRRNPQFGWVDQVGIGSLVVRNVPVEIRRVSSEGGPHIDGIVGTQFLSHFTVRLDFRRDRVLLAPHRTEKREGVAMMFGADRHLILQGTLEDREAWFFLNTSLYKCDFSPSPDIPSARRLRLGPISSDKPEVDAAVYPPRIDMSVFGFPVEGVIGYPLLRDHILTFDFHSMTVQID